MQQGELLHLDTKTLTTSTGDKWITRTAAPRRGEQLRPDLLNLVYIPLFSLTAFDFDCMHHPITMTADLSTTVGGIPLTSAVYNASGPRTGTSAAMAKIAASASGGVLAKSATVGSQKVESCVVLCQMLMI